MNKLFAIAAVAALSVSTAAVAAVTFDADTGTGFVGKGDVQLAFGWNNAALQSNASGVSFTYASQTVTQVSWNCIKDQVTGNGTVREIIQERRLTTTDTRTGVVTKVDRVRNQINGFTLSGYTSSTSNSTSDGPALNSCPNSHSRFELDETAGEPQVISSTGGLFVNHGGTSVQIN